MIVTLFFILVFVAGLVWIFRECNREVQEQHRRGDP